MFEHPLLIVEQVLVVSIKWWILEIGKWGVSTKKEIQDGLNTRDGST